MPFTFLAHQAPVIPLKMARPRWFDGTALCIGSMTPDLANAFEGLWRVGHRPIGLLVWTLPVTQVACGWVRWRGASVAFAHLPDLGPLRLRSYRVLADRRPAWWITASSALIGGFTHLLLDSFTHEGRSGSGLLGLNDVVAEAPVVGEVTEARLLQYLGHSLGSVACVVLLWVMARRRLLEQWYGEEAVARARAVTVDRRSRWWFLAAVGGGVAIGGLWVLAVRSPGYLPFQMIDGTLLGLVVACMLPATAPRPTGADRESAGVHGPP